MKTKMFFIFGLFCFLSNLFSFSLRVINGDHTLNNENSISSLRFCNADLFQEYRAEWIDASEQFFDGGVVFDSEYNVNSFIKNIYLKPRYINKFKNFGIKCEFGNGLELVFWLPPLGFISRGYTGYGFRYGEFLELNNLFCGSDSIDIIFYTMDGTPRVRIKNNSRSNCISDIRDMPLTVIRLENICSLVQTFKVDQGFSSSRKLYLQKSPRRSPRDIFSWASLPDNVVYHGITENFKMQFSRYGKSVVCILDKNILFNFRRLNLFSGFTKENRFELAIAGCLREEDENIWQIGEILREEQL